MKTVTLQEFLTDEEHPREAARILRDDGLVCFPCRGTYRIAASLRSERAVLALLQTRRRSKHKPALVLVASIGMLNPLVQEIPAPARKVIEALWPGDVTLRLPLSQDGLPRKVYKELSKPDRKAGFRVAVSPAAQLLVRAADVPLLVSSANLSQKTGAASVAAIRKNFARRVDLLVDSGDLPQQPPSTVIDFTDDGTYKVVRAGTVSEEDVAAAAAG